MTVEVRPSPDGWDVMHVGLLHQSYPRKQSAESEARRLARKFGTELIIYRENLSVQDIHRYPHNNGW